MSSVRAIVRNTVALAAADIISKLAVFGLSIAIARRLGSEAFGTYSFALAFAFFFGLAADFGISKLLIRQIARNRETASQYLGNAVPLKIILTIGAYAIFAIVVWGIGYPPETGAILLIFGASLLGDTIAHTFRAVFFAFERMEYEAIIRALEKIAAFGLSGLAIALGYGIIGIAWAFLAVTAANVLGSAVLARRFLRISFRLDTQFMKNLLQTAWPFLLVNFFFLVYFKIDMVMLSFMRGDAVVGWYNAAYHIIEGLMFIPVVFISAMFPVMSKFAVSHLPSLQMSVRRSLIYLLIAAAPIAAGGILLSDMFISLVYGSAFVKSALTLQILLVALVFIFIIRPLAAALNTIEKQKLNLTIMIVFSILNILLNFVFIPVFSHVGAAITTLICEAILFWVYVYFYQKYIGRLGVAKPVGKIIVASGILAGIVWLARPLPLAAIFGIGALAYVALIILLQVVPTGEWKELKEAIFSKQQDSTYILNN